MKWLVQWLSLTDPMIEAVLLTKESKYKDQRQIEFLKTVVRLF